MPRKDPEARKAYRIAHYAENRARLLAQKAVYYAKKLAPYARQREQIQNASRAYYHPNKEKVRASRYARRKILIARSKAYRAANRDIAHALLRRYRARKRAAPINDLTAAQWRAIKAHYGHRCVYCQRKMQRLTMDHITPLSKGGNHTVQNVVPACHSCNGRKHAGPPLKPIHPLLFIG